MTAIKINLSKDITELKIHTFADWHIGDESCNMDEIKKQIEEVKNDDNSYCILNGDLVNNATKSSVSDCYSATLSPMQQIETLVELLTPIKHKILAITTGNHERRTYKGDGIDITKLVAKELKLDDRYADSGAVIFVRFGWNALRKRKHWYSIYVTHGCGGGKKAGGKVNRLEDLVGIVDADIYIHSHTHLPFVMKQAFYRTDSINSNVSIVDKLFVNTSAKLEYGGYGEIFEYRPASKDTPVIYLSGVKKEFYAKL